MAIGLTANASAADLLVLLTEVDVIVAVQLALSEDSAGVV